MRGLYSAEPADPGQHRRERAAATCLDGIIVKLVRYNTDNAAPELDIAESIETEDNQNFTVKLKPG